MPWALIYRQRVPRLHSLETASDECAKCCASMQGAIGKLEKGDVECRIRAALLSRALNRWFVEWDLLEEARIEGLRTRRIEDTIPGKTCPRCLRERHCKTCAQSLRDYGTRDESCKRCKPFKLSRLCQRCRTRQATIGWKPTKKWLKEQRKEEVSASEADPMQEDY